MNKPRILMLAGMIFSAALDRVLPHPWNFTPVAAMALFGGANFSDKRLAFLVPLTAVFLSDMVLGFYPLWGVVYAAHALVVVIGIQLRNHKSIPALGGASVAASLTFFLVSNLAEFFSSGLYAKSIAGLVQCYTLAIPFLRNTLLGDLFFTGILFGTFSLAEKKFPLLQESSLRAH